jgi:hypothetical protein
VGIALDAATLDRIASLHKEQAWAAIFTLEFRQIRR